MDRTTPRFRTAFFLAFVMGMMLISGCLGDRQSEPIPNDPTEITSNPTADGTANVGRVAWQKPEVVINMLGDLEGKTVADIGAGTGFFAFRLVFRAGKVIAIDIDEQMIQLMETFKLNLPVDVQERFETRLSEADDAHLEEDEADVVIIINTIGYIEDRLDYLKHLKNGLKPNGQLMIVDFKMKHLPISAPPQELRVPIYIIERELQQAGYESIRTDDTSLDYQFVVIASNP